MEDNKMDIDVKVEELKGAPKRVVKETSEPKVSSSTKHTSKVVVSATKPKDVLGNYELVALDKDGNEKGNSFTVTAKTYNRAYTDTTKFKVKKKAI